MLHKIGLLTASEMDELEKELAQITSLIEDGDFIIEDQFEDVHSKVEFMLTEKLGDTGKKIHTARSRNDQVLVDVHLYLRAEIKEINVMMQQFFNLLIELAETHKDKLLPGLYSFSSCHAFFFWDVVFGLCREFDR